MAKNPQPYGMRLAKVSLVTARGKIVWAAYQFRLRGGCWIPTTKMSVFRQKDFSGYNRR